MNSRHLLLSLFALSQLAQASALMDPKNDPDVIPHITRGYFQLPEGSSQPQSTMTRELAEQLATDFLTYSRRLTQGQSRPLIIDINWDSPYFTANAKYTPQGLVINVWGGYLRAPKMTPAVLVFTMCHELGHLVGGEPKQTNELKENVTIEGASDFYAALNCTDLFLSSYPKYAPTISEEVRELCQGRVECEYSLEAGVETFRYLQKWSFVPYEPVQLKFIAPAAKELILNTYPSYQCRVETVLTAGLCLREGQRQGCQPPPCWWPAQGPRFPPAQPSTQN